MPTGKPNKLNSLAIINPTLAKQWHPTKNGSLTPKDVVPGSHKKVWWKCPKGPDHEWNSGTIRDRHKGSGCPFCSGQKASKNNNLKLKNPNIAKQWHPTKNGSLTPKDVVPGSHKKVWWKCPKGPDHEWFVAIHLRGINNLGCPFCSNRRVSITNRLDKLDKELAKQWHPTKNGSLTPKDVTYSSSKLVWWKCPKGHDHEWKVRVDSRATGRKNGCPFCSGHKVSVTNNLKTLYPNIAKQWDKNKNKKNTPETIVAGSTEEYWWKCPKGPDHEWKASSLTRIKSKYNKCPFCSNFKASVTNSISSIYPEIAKQWHPTKNGSLTPKDVTYSSSKLVWWKCPKGPDHEWKAQVYERTSGKTGCPFCYGHKVSVTNNLETLYPNIAKQWHPTKNGSLTPKDVIAGGHKMIWFKCENGTDHIWKADLSSRVKENKGCPFCYGHKVSVTNNLETLSPEIAKQWHPTKNGSLTPKDVHNGNKKKAWWKCENFNNHIWQAQISSRTIGGRGCPHCVLTPRSALEIKLAYELSSLINFDLNKHKIRIENKLVDVDILLENLKVIIEYDGSYWHLNKFDKDKTKTNLLVKNGWNVIRIRENPLKKITKNDIQVPTNCNTKEVANLTIIQLENVLGKKIKGSKQYIKKKELSKEKESSKAIKNYILKNKRNKNSKIK